MDDISVLVCDDSALMRNLISRIIESTPGLTVAGTAMNGQFAVEKIPALKPDVLVLDIEMPVMNGVEFLKKRRELHWDIPVIILSSIATKGAAVTMQCLELGASDFITKPNGSVSADLSSVASQLVEEVASYGGQYARRRGKEPYSPEFFIEQAKIRAVEKAASDKIQAAAGAAGKAIPVPSEAEAAKTRAAATELLKSYWSNSTRETKEPAVITPVREGGPIELIAIGISTGGPNALRDVFKMIDPHLKQPVLVVQHMPAGFTAEFANSLDHICALDVKEAADGDEIQSGRILIAPGNYHIYVERNGLGKPVVRTSQSDLRNGHRPSADVLFESVAKVYQNRALGVIMTGMGRDGAAEITEMRRQGAWTLGQDEESSVVYGMPKVAWELGGVQRQVSLRDMADAISTLARDHLPAGM